MQCEVIPVNTSSSVNAAFYTYILDSSKEFQPNKIRPMLIVCPGGGYGMTSDREAEPIAMRVLAMGYHVGILRYSVAPARFPTALLELAEAMKMVHENQKAWNVDTNKIFVMGSSAGGHLAASLGVFWKRPFLCEMANVTQEILKPCGLILNYPVITSERPYAHEGSFANLLGDKAEEMKEKVSIEKLVTKEMPPCFIWHTFTDKSVPPENSLLLAQALSKAGVSAELHMYPVGGHGLSLADRTTCNEDGSALCGYVQSWIDLLGVWLENKINE